ncbi:ATP-binding protein [Pseudoduganella aquatica]|uniref:histidine kinase n=1 Tax=Pseudoduganella aquatica TaxID=2660641 RepID=A0A7X4HD97_9BURK|nr:ATP-binding protein [Pseudoduganella aquatica]MYN08809.1 sensor histidine kinase [Pseudoduganella aquatica]
MNGTAWAAGALRGLRRRVFSPSLVRRLLGAQMALLTLLWSLAVGFVLAENETDHALLNTDQIYAAALHLADSAAEHAAWQREGLRLFDVSLRSQPGMDGPAELLPSILVERGGRELYRSPNAPSGVATRRLDRVETFELDGKRWHARTRQARPGGARMTMFAPDHGWNLFVTLNSHGYYLLPLLISLPLLLLPAWLSIRVALRPWHRVAQELALRGPQDLRPLAFQAQYRELAAMVEALNALMLRVDKSAARERSFIADAAHELRTPLAAMRVNVEALLVQAGSVRDKQLLSGIVSSARRATRLVSQLLTLMRSDAIAGDASERVALDELLQDRLAALSGLAAVRWVELELSAEPGFTVCGQRESLISLVDNVVENAIKYGPGGGVVRVALRRAGQGASVQEAVLTVEDQGPGIAPALRERVFDRFFRDPAQTQSGSGLGLAIAQAAAARHGGRIALLDGEGGGLLVEVRLPLAA